jgi:cytochrome c-type biogenesis protein CcmH/NrfG
MTRPARWLSVLWPLLLFMLFAATFRRAPSEAADTSVDRCHDLEAAATAPAVAADIARLEQCVAIDARNAELMIDLGRAHAASQRPDQAEKWYRRALDVDPINSDLHVMLGELLLDRGDRDGARREAEAALRWRPNGLAATRLLSRALAPPEPAR